MKRVKSRAILGGLVVVLAACAAGTTMRGTLTPFPSKEPNGPSGQVVVGRYPDSNDLIIYNGTATDIFIPYPASDNDVGERTFRFYQKTPLGWNRLYPLPIPDLTAGWVPGGPPGLVISPGHEEAIAISEFLIAYTNPLTGTYLVQVRYQRGPTDKNDNLVLYSNEFQVTAPVNQTYVTVTLEPSRPLTFDLSNAADVPIWFIDVCSSWGIKGGVEDGYLSLQRQTSDEGWELIHGTCKSKMDPKEIDPGQTLKIDGTRWFKEKLDGLTAGTYRWDIVFYLAINREWNKPFLEEVRHIFSEPFKYDPNS